MSEAQMMLSLAQPLQKLVADKFRTAYKDKSILFSETAVALLRTQKGAPFQLRYCPALAKKPKADGAEEKKEPARPKFDPFADPPDELLVANIPANKASHILVLNKFPVIHNHFIIATKANKPQTAILEKEDLGITHACLHAWQHDQHDQHGQNSSRLFAFFNSGEHSGASQPHRHLQFLPVEDMASPEAPAWELLLDRMTVRAHPELPLFQDPSLPFLHFSTPLEDGLSLTDLYSKYLLLLNAAMSAVRFPDQPLHQNLEVEEDGRAVFSYNLAMTTGILAICPRSREAVAMPESGATSSVALNGTLLGGTLMVKDEVEWDVLRHDHALLDGILAGVGYPPVSWEPNGNEIKL
ncbi:hypothetical protein A1O1_05302 [Capronia coronata CBS 617.96]|uniref:Uncharacterized protein n=1 Tax=Capronia coronata CBS 617.96 TaxID=1182541 RepID=W9Y6C7_9EURO|nr:uncharacterized protein A1O1_05302 [Capronia coronata CBS 617.96]EXJ88372.1 hypothetical protein A1O1_05302 [Capronia coronata CBS 617.96]